MPLRRLAPFLAIFLIIETALRLSLLARASLEVDFTAGQVATLLGMGLWFDLATSGFVLLPAMLYTLGVPRSAQGGRLDRLADAGLRLAYCFVLLFDAVAEHIFWTEFSSRFNFIAVDYLIYTREVVGNIRESYPVGWIIAGIAAAAWVAARLSYRYFPAAAEKAGLGRRFAGLSAAAAVGVLLNFASDASQARIRGNDAATELASNGIYSLFSAAWNNEISFDRFYAHEDEPRAYEKVRELLGEQGVPLVRGVASDLTRLVRRPGGESRKNVILVVMESMSADYMGAFGNQAGLTPNLDRLAEDGLLFARHYATGTRTVRGLEAVTLSIPPTPGQSIVRRPGNADLFSLGFVFQDRGYDTRFIYGGFGYFDNMNAFFAGNGFGVLDRADMRRDEVQFANIWGICDEDIFARALEEADASSARGRPFLQLILTTSNHRPFTFPEGRIDTASYPGRLGGVRYADYSIGKLVRDARSKSWFKDTVFVFVGDHTAGAGGKADLDPPRYHVPLIFYSPGSIGPGRFEGVASQIDLAPTLLGLLNFSYYSRFYGVDLLNDRPAAPRAFISNYQKVALMEGDRLTVLAPNRVVEQYGLPEMSARADLGPEAEDAIAFYQSASHWRENHARIPTVAEAAPTRRNRAGRGAAEE